MMRISTRATVSARPRSKAVVKLVSQRVLTLGLALGAGAALAACTASASSVEPPDNQFFFPTANAVSLDESVLYVTNGNSDLRYDSGSLNVVDLAYTDQVAGNWVAGGTIPTDNDCAAYTPDGTSMCCSPDPNHIESLICDESHFIRPEAGARLGNFSTDIAIQDTNNGSLRLIIPTRGDPSITWVDWDGSNLSCNADGKQFELCDDDHRLAYILNDENIGLLPEEPFFAWASSTGQFAVVTHFTTGDVSLINSPIGGMAEVTDLSVGLFYPDPNTGEIGTTGVAGRPGSNGDIVYVGSSSEDRIQMYTVGHPVNGAPPFFLPDNFFFLDGTGQQAGESSDTRAMRFSADGSRMYLVNRNPPSLQVWDTSADATGFPANQLLSATDICREASEMQVVDSGDGDRVYISCFEDGLIDVIDPSGGGQLIDQIESGSGPYGVAASATRKKIYVTNFLEDTVSVIDIAPGSATRDHVVLRVGTIKPPIAPTSSSTPILF